MKEKIKYLISDWEMKALSLKAERLKGPLNDHAKQLKLLTGELGYLQCISDLKKVLKETGEPVAL